MVPANTSYGLINVVPLGESPALNLTQPSFSNHLHRQVLDPLGPSIQALDPIRTPNECAT